MSDNHYDPNEPRDTHGRWTTGGAGAAATNDPRVTDVEGDEWNKQTAARLEKEYAAARPMMDAMAQEAVVKDAEAPAGVEPQSWEELSGDAQQEAETKYVDDNLSSQLDNEVESWHDNGEALGDAAHALAEDSDWKHETLTDFIKARDEEGAQRIPYSPEDLGAAIKIEAADHGSSDTDPTITFDDSKLKYPDNNVSPDQMGLPGIEGPKPEDSLTEAMREEIIAHFTEEFNSKAASNATDLEPPEYLKDNAKEYLEESWSSMGDEEKYEWTKSNTELIENGDESAASGKIGWPSKFDPMNATSNEDYRNTQRLARYLSVERAARLLGDRGLSGDLADDAELRTDIARADHELWAGWKSSSSQSDGKLIQVAAHEEFGGHLNTESRGIKVNEAQDYANEHYKAVGGYDGVKALMRAKWETTQYLLDRANMPIVEGYRGLTEVVKKLPAVGTGGGAPTFTEFKTDERTRSEHMQGADGLDYTKLPDVRVIRNGAASFTTDPSVANGWRGGDRVVIRSMVPRTSVLSVPAYGVNVHSEREYVVMGTAWKNWDLWYDRAPKFADMPMKPHVVKSVKPVIDKAEKEHAA